MSSRVSKPTPLTSNKKESTVTTKPNARSKTPKRTPAATEEKTNTPVPTPEAVSPAVVAASAKPQPKVSNKGKKTKNTRVVKSKTQKPPATPQDLLLDKLGIVMNLARVISVFKTAMNPAEAEARDRIDAELKKLRLLKEETPVPSEEKKQKAKPQKRDPPTPIDKLPANIREIIARGREEYSSGFEADYVRYVIRNMKEATRIKYENAKKAAIETCREKVREYTEKQQAIVDKMESHEEKAKYVKDTYEKEIKKLSFDEKAFNKSFDKNFYNGFEEYCIKYKKLENLPTDAEGYLFVGGERIVRAQDRGNRMESKQSKPNYYKPKNEWIVAKTYINKLMYRISQNVRHRLASFMDILVEQISLNAIYNAVLSGKHNAHSRHATNLSRGFEQRIPLYGFFSTLRTYHEYNDWNANCDAIHENNKSKKAEGVAFEPVEAPDYPRKDDPQNRFQIYVKHVHKAVRRRMASNDEFVQSIVSQIMPADSKKADVDKKIGEIRDVILKLNMRSDCSSLCSMVVAETIGRIGRALSATLVNRGSDSEVRAKTVSDKMVMITLQQLHELLGITFAPVESEIMRRISVNLAYQASQKDKKGKAKVVKVQETNGTHEEDTADADAAGDDEADVDPTYEDS
jgi:hypothetical protein